MCENVLRKYGSEFKTSEEQTKDELVTDIDGHLINMDPLLNAELGN